MINSFKLLGQDILRKAGYYQEVDEEKRRKLLLDKISLVPQAKCDKSGELFLEGKSICLNFDLNTKTIEFRLSQIELMKENREELFAFKLANPKDKKKFLMTNNLSTFLGVVFKESLEYLIEKKNKKQSSGWIRSNISEEYLKLLEDILHEFYVISDNKVYLDYDKLIPAQRDLYQKIYQGISEEKKKPPEFDEIYYRLLNKQFHNRDSKNIDKLSPLFLITFNGKTILDYKDGRYAEDYINTCYYDLVQRYFTEKNQGTKYCHICHQEKEVIQDLPLTMKFYGTTNELNFENLKSSNAYKSFCICESCINEVVVGMKTVEIDLRDYLFDLSVYIIPRDKPEEISLLIYKGIIRILKKARSSYKHDIEKLKEIIDKSQRKNLVFDIMFYNHPPGSQQFDIIRLISNIELNSLINKLKYFDSVSHDYGLDTLESKKGDSSLTLSDLRNYLFPSWFSEPKQPDYSVLGRKLVEFLDRFLTGKKSSYNELISNFVKIYKKRLHREKIDVLSPFKMVLALKIFYDLGQIREGEAMEKGNAVTEVIQPEYAEFFGAHPEIYQNNYYRQGLFLLGTIISRIKYAQREKSSNILRKMNLSGMSVRRVPGFVNQVREIAEIYKKELKYLDPSIWGELSDRLQNIESSGLKNDEVVFFILTGLSYQDYLGIKYGKEKRDKNTIMEDEDES
jgi:CRISPR-associated protein Cas8b/Csh1 subtype I-B